MSEENKAIVRRFFAEVINAGHTNRAEEVVTADYVERQHVPDAEGCRGIEVAKAFLSMMRNDAPSLLRLPVQRRGSGRRSGRGGGMPHRERRTPGEMLGLAPTGKRIRTSGIEVFRFASGTMAAYWATCDARGWLRQIRIGPSPGLTLLARTLASQVRKRLPTAR